MADEPNRTNNDTPDASDPEQNTPNQEANLTTDDGAANAADDQMKKRVDRLGGEPAPAISPEEFARLQQAGQIHIDSRGRVRTNRREETDAGMSLRKRRAWYAGA